MQAQWFFWRRKTWTQRHYRGKMMEGGTKEESVHTKAKG
jgi:hypothetical protein